MACIGATMAAFAALAGVAAAATPPPVRFPIEVRGGAAIRSRLRMDLAAALGSRAAAGVAVPADLDGLRARIEATPDDVPRGFRTIMPFSDLQAEVFALNAAALRARGFPALSAWRQNPWDPLLPMQAPVAPCPLPALRVDLMRGEWRSDAFCLTNATDRAVTATVRVVGFAGGPNPVWISVREVQFTDTYVHQPIAAALPVAPACAGGVAVRIPAGTTRQVWLAVHAPAAASGMLRGRVEVRAPGAAALRLPMCVRVVPLAAPADGSMAVGGWDYVHGERAALDAACIDPAVFVRFLREHGVNTPWSGGMPLAGCAFAADGAMTHAPDFAAWDRWVARWPGARWYGHFLGLGPSFYGEPAGTPRFRRMVGEWASALASHARLRGIEPHQLLLLLVDEPSKPEQERVIAAFAGALHAAEPGLTVWEDPVRADPAQADPEMLASCDILCPMASMFVTPGPYRAFFVEQARRGRPIWFYSCVNGKHLDPAYYHRGQFWLAIRYGAGGSCYWAFGDEGGAGSSFRAYTSPGHMFSPLFLDPEMGIVDGKHMQAIREGAEDAACFATLRRRVEALEAAGCTDPALRAARGLLASGPERVERELTLDRIEWDVPKDRSIMDRVRVEVLDALDRLRGVRAMVRRGPPSRTR